MTERGQSSARTTSPGRGERYFTARLPPLAGAWQEFPPDPRLAPWAVICRCSAAWLENGFCFGVRAKPASAHRFSPASRLFHAFFAGFRKNHSKTTVFSPDFFRGRAIQESSGSETSAAGRFRSRWAWKSWRKDDSGVVRPGNFSRMTIRESSGLEKSATGRFGSRLARKSRRQADSGVVRL